jgi:prepilin-type N-terminal cleavage/methylation domain-containing protein
MPSSPAATTLFLEFSDFINGRKTIMRSSKGFTLIELAVVLAIIAILAAILTPIVTSYIDQARDVRARADVGAIARAVMLYQRDTGRYPIYDTFATATADTATADLLVTSGSAPNSSGGWAGLTTDPLNEFLNVNKLGLATGAGTGGNLGAVAFRGPYLDTVMQGDPWGNQYIVTAAHLRRNSQANWAFVLSAGPDANISTIYANPKTTALNASGDDLVALIR